MVGRRERREIGEWREVPRAAADRRDLRRRACRDAVHLHPLLKKAGRVVKSKLIRSGGHSLRHRRYSQCTLEQVERRQLLSTFMVNTTSDVTNPGDGFTTLREAVVAANAHAGADTVLFDAKLFTTSSQHTVTLIGGQLTLTDTSGATTISGPGAAWLAVSGNYSSRIFAIDSGVTVNIVGFTITGGVVSTASSTAPAQGGGISSAGTLTLTGVTVSNSTAYGDLPSTDITGAAAQGGGIYSTGALTLIGSTVTGNGAQAAGGDSFGGDAAGGGIYCTASLSVTSSTIAHNGAIGGDNRVNRDRWPSTLLTTGSARGGGVYAAGLSSAFTDSTISDNSAVGGAAAFYGNNGGSGAGGGLYCAAGTLSISRSTFSRNSAAGAGSSSEEGGPGALGSGGGIYTHAAASISDSTFALNSVQSGWGSGYPDGSTVAGGEASGGAIYTDASLVIADSTISGNSAVGAIGIIYAYTGAAVPPGTGNGGGVSVAGTGTAVLTNTIVSANQATTADADIHGTVNTTASAYNLIGVGGGLTNGVNHNKVGVTNPQLQTLGNYGGPTQTMRPVWPSSPALDAGGNALVPAGMTTDQRGSPRIVGPAVDIGSVEVGLPVTGVISGTVYNDTNGDGIHQSTEPPLKGWQLILDTNNNAKLDAGERSVVSDASGNYKFTGLPGGTYVLREVVPKNWCVSSPLGAYYKLTIKDGGSATGRLFENTQKAFIGGSVFNDANGNGIKDSTETGLSAWRVYIDANNDGVFQSSEKSVLSDAKGNWQFTNLTPGTYAVRIVQQAGYTRTTPTTGSFSIGVGLGSYRSGNLFGERKVT
jgi:hypothetical protein